jgi:hypothetical protein
MGLPVKTIVYYTANTQNPVFEQKIIDDLKKKVGNIPIVSVSQKPIDLGTNICVGQQPFSYTSEWKQLLIGLKAAKGRFCYTAEADCLYPEGYFDFTPPEDDMVYNYNHIWIVWKNHSGAYKKHSYCEGAQVCGREYWIDCLEPLLPDDWTPYTREEENSLVQKIFSKRKEFIGNPVISFKTDGAVSCRTTYDKDSKTDVIPYWGDINKLKKEFFYV